MKSLTALSIPAISVVLNVIAACSGDVATPRQRAYPRAALYDTLYVEAEGFPVRFEVNADAGMRRAPGREGWFDIVYPGYFDGSAVNCTLQELGGGDRLRVAIDNRAERMSLNAGTLQREILNFKSVGGWNCEIVITPSSRVTPVQFLAEDGRRLLTGVYTVPARDGVFAPDSAAPYIDAVSRDIIHLLKSLE